MFWASILLFLTLSFVVVEFNWEDEKLPDTASMRTEKKIPVSFSVYQLQQVDATVLAQQQEKTPVSFRYSSGNYRHCFPVKRHQYCYFPSERSYHHFCLSTSANALCKYFQSEEKSLDPGTPERLSHKQKIYRHFLPVHGDQHKYESICIKLIQTRVQPIRNKPVFTQPLTTVQSCFNHIF